MATQAMTGLTGRLFEWSLLGRAPATPTHEYMPFQEAMALARRLCPWDPTDPEPRQANDLHFHVCRALGVDDFSRVRVFSALGTPLDRFHGVDFWVEFGDGVVTIDLTANKSKNRHKADVVVHPEELEDGGKALAAHIAALLQPARSKRPS